MVVSVIKTNFVGGNRKVIATFDNVSDAVDYGSKINGNRMPLRVDKLTFMWESDDDMVFTEVDNFYQFRVGSVVQSDNNHSPIRFTDAKVIQCFANGYYPNYMVRFQDGSTRIVREKDIRIQRLF